MPRGTLRWLLYLFPREFRVEFTAEIDEYVESRRREVRPAGTWAATRVSFGIAGELAVTGARHRVLALWSSRLVLYAAALLAGLVIGAGSLAAVLVAFENLVRLPLLAIARDGVAGTGSARHLAALGAGITMLFALYVALLPGPRKRWHTSD